MTNTKLPCIWRDGCNQHDACQAAECCQAIRSNREKQSKLPPSKELDVQPVMWLVFEYARIMDGSGALVGEERAERVRKAHLKDEEIRNAIRSLVASTHEPPAECSGCEEFVRMQHDIASILGVDADTDSIDLHGRIYGALSSQPPKTITRVVILCNAYESGFGHGLQGDGLPNPYTRGSEEWEAYQEGYNVAFERRAASPPSADHICGPWSQCDAACADRASPPEVTQCSTCLEAHELLTRALIAADNNADGDLLDKVHDAIEVMERADVWQPISTAPRNGTRILLAAEVHAPNGKPRISSGYYSTDPYIGGANNEVIGAEEGFQGDGDQCIPSNQECFTHWAPIPPLSSTATKGDSQS
jgi:hypothetical protein